MSKFNEVYSKVLKESVHSQKWEDALEVAIGSADEGHADKLCMELDAYVTKFPGQYKKNRLMQKICDLIWSGAGYIPSPDAQRMMGIDVDLTESKTTDPSKSDIEDGRKIKVYQWRNKTSFMAKTTGKSYYDKDRDCYAVDIDGGSGEAVWNENKNRWEDGEL